MTIMNERIPVRVKSRILLINPEDLECATACGNYVRLHTATEKYLVRGTIQAFEQRLAHMGFIRVHRSTLVNVSRVVSVEVAASGDSLLHLSSGRSVTLSRTFRKPFFAFVTVPAAPPLAVHTRIAAAR